MHQFRHKRPSFEALPTPNITSVFGMDDTMGGCSLLSSFFQLLHAPFDDFFLGRGVDGQMRKEEIFLATQFPIQFLLGPYLITFFWQNWVVPQKKLDRKPKIAKIKG
jgi:hypothetical protein